MYYLGWKSGPLIFGPDLLYQVLNALLNLVRLQIVLDAPLKELEMEQGLLDIRSGHGSFHKWGRAILGSSYSVHG